MEKKYLVGIDLGNSGIRVACFDFNGNCVGNNVADVSTYSPEPGQLTNRVKEVEDAVIESMHNMLMNSNIDPAMIAGISSSIAGGRLTGIDENGDYPFESIFTNGDKRVSSYFPKTYEKLAAAGISPEKYRELTHSTLIYNTLILALRDTEPEKAATIKKWAYSHHPMIVRALGTEEWVDVEGWATSTGCYNPYTRELNKDICNALDIQPEDWVTYKFAGEPCGTVSEEVAAKTGLVAGTPIYVGNNDNTPHIIAQGAINEKDVASTLGTYGVLFRLFSTPIHDIANSVFLGCSGFKAGNAYKMTTLVMGMGASYNWLHKNICFGFEPEAEKAGKNIYEYMNELAAKSSIGANGVLFNPNVLGSLTNSKMKASFLGIGVTNTVNDLVRAVMEGVAYDYKIALQNMDEATKIKSESIYVSGGIAKSEFWLQIFADVCNVPLLKAACQPDLTACLGAAMTAGIGAGVYSSLEDAVEKAVKTPTVINPIPENVECYQKFFKEYQKDLKILTEEVYV